LRGLFCRKVTKSRPLISDFSIKIQVQLTSLSEQLSNSIHGGKQLSFIIHQYSSSSMFHFLRYVAEVLSSFNNRERQTNRIEFDNLARQTQHIRMGTKSPTRLFPFLSGSWIRPPPRLQEPHATVRRQVVTTLAPVFGRMRTSFKEGGGYVHVSGQSGT